MANPSEIIIGLIGDAAAGKDFIAEKIVERGFVFASASAIVREEIHRRKLTPSRELQTQIANEVRSARGGDYFVAEALRRARRAAETGRIVISGIYTLSEGEYLKRERATLIHVRTPEEEVENDLQFRYSLLAKRRDGKRDELTYEQFCAAHTRENSGETPLQANVSALAAMADTELINAHDEPLLAQQLTVILERIDHAKL